MLPTFLSDRDWHKALEILKGRWREPDLIIAPDGNPCLYRWHIIPRNNDGNVYLHIQVADDPKRPLHDHPWESWGNMLAGTYREEFCAFPKSDPNTYVRLIHKGMVVHRSPEFAHRLTLPAGVPYTMTLFTTGPKLRRWGFWYPEGWVDAAEVCQESDGVSIHRRKE